MYGLVTEGDPFRVYTRRNNAGGALIIRFECKEGMGVLGIRKSGRTDPAPSVAYEEEDIDPTSLRAGRFVHVLPSGQRQSYALSRISAEVAVRLPSDRWVELKPHTEYGFRYLVAPDNELDGTTAAVELDARPAPSPSAPSTPRAVPRAVPHAAPHAASHAAPPKAAIPVASPLQSPPREPTIPAPPAHPPTIPTHDQNTPLPSIAEAALRGLSREQAIEHLKVEMHKVHTLQRRLTDLEDSLKRSRARERDLIELLAKWDASRG